MALSIPFDVLTEVFAVINLSVSMFLQDLTIYYADGASLVQEGAALHLELNM